MPHSQLLRVRVRVTGKVLVVDRVTILFRLHRLVVVPEAHVGDYCSVAQQGAIHLLLAW